MFLLGLGVGIIVGMLGLLAVLALMDGGCIGEEQNERAYDQWHAHG